MFADVVTMRDTSFLIGLIVMSLFGVAGLLVARNNVSPVTEISKAMELLSVGDSPLINGSPGR